MEGKKQGEEEEEEEDDDAGQKTTAEEGHDEEGARNAAALANLNCSICLNFLCQPLRTQCGHLFCRVCLLQSKVLSPDGRTCPLCRGVLAMGDPLNHPVDQDAQREVRKAVPSSEYEMRLSSARAIYRRIEEEARTMLPLFTCDLFHVLESQ